MQSREHTSWFMTQCSFSFNICMLIITVFDSLLHIRNCTLFLVWKTNASRECVQKSVSHAIYIAHVCKLIWPYVWNWIIFNAINSQRNWNNCCLPLLLCCCFLFIPSLSLPALVRTDILTHHGSIYWSVSMKFLNINGKDGKQLSHCKRFDFDKIKLEKAAEEANVVGLFCFSFRFVHLLVY